MLNDIYKLDSHRYKVIEETTDCLLLERIDNPIIWVQCDKNDKDLIKEQ